MSCIQKHVFVKLVINICPAVVSVQNNYVHCNTLPLPNIGSASRAQEGISRVGMVMGKCTAPAGSAVHWIPLPTVPHGPSCRGR